MNIVFKPFEAYKTYEGDTAYNIRFTVDEVPFLANYELKTLSVSWHNRFVAALALVAPFNEETCQRLVKSLFEGDNAPLNFSGTFSELKKREGLL